MSEVDPTHPSGDAAPVQATETARIVDTTELVIGGYDVMLKGGEPTGCFPAPGRRKVALVGFAESTKHEAPYKDTSWEIWSLNQHYRHMDRASRWFEIHDDFLSDQVEGTDYLAWLRACPIAVYMCGESPVQASIPSAVNFPIKEATELLGIDYWQSSLAYMLALALLEQFDQIAIYGVDLIIGEEYAYQKPNLEYILGVAKGMGYTISRGKAKGVAREIFIPEYSALLRQTYRYGYEKPPHNIFLDLLVDRRTHLLKQKEELLAGIYHLDGALNDNDQWIHAADLHKRGAVVQWKKADGKMIRIPPPIPLSARKPQE